MKREYLSFKEFYPFYLSQHSNRTCRTLHFIGISGVLAIVIWVLISGHPWRLSLAPVVAYGFAWAGHFFFERNRPATFTYPFYSLAGDWVMWKDILIGKERL